MRQALPTKCKVECDAHVVRYSKGTVLVGEPGCLCWLIRREVWDAIPLFADIVGEPDGSHNRVMLLLHGGNRIYDKHGYWVYSRNEQEVLPVFKYLHALFEYMHNDVVRVPNDLCSLMYMEYFISIMFRLDCTHRVAAGFHEVILRMIESKLAQMTSLEIKKN